MIRSDRWPLTSLGQLSVALIARAGAKPHPVRPAGRPTMDGGAGAASRSRATRLIAPLLLGHARLIRFALVGGVCAAVQLALLALFLGSGVEAVLANTVAFLLSAQLNFALSLLFIWGDRHAGARPARGLVSRWLAFHGSIAGTALLNQAVFVLARTAAPDLIASALGIGVAAVVNFLVQDRLIFRGRRAPAL